MTVTLLAWLLHTPPGLVVIVLITGTLVVTPPLSLSQMPPLEVHTGHNGSASEFKTWTSNLEHQNRQSMN